MHLGKFSAVFLFFGAHLCGLVLEHPKQKRPGGLEGSDRVVLPVSDSVFPLLRTAGMRALQGAEQEERGSVRLSAAGLGDLDDFRPDGQLRRRVDRRDSKNLGRAAHVHLRSDAGLRGRVQLQPLRVR